MTLLNEYYSVAMLICWYTMSSDCLRYYVNVLCWFIRCAFSLFSSFTLFFGSLSVVRVSIS